MTAPDPSVKGWCPSAYRPMMSGDGLVVRIRPNLARLKQAQILELCDLAERFGSGILEFTNRANLQLRGISEAGFPELLDALNALEVLDTDPEIERRRNILVNPFWKNGDRTVRLANGLAAKLDKLPDLPAKFGFAVDTGEWPVLAEASADIRLEALASGDILVRADGMQSGVACDESNAIDTVLAMADWFARNATNEARRMRTLLGHIHLPEHWTQHPAATPAPVPGLGQCDQGQLVAVPFGQIDAKTLRACADLAEAIRLTPWRILLLERVTGFSHPDLVTDQNDPLLQADACPGAPLCASASVATRALARQIAPLVAGRVHVSGCSKGCARSKASDVTLVGRDGLFDIVRSGTAQASPERTGLSPKEISKELSA